MKTIGLDGCPSGWLGIELTDDKAAYHVIETTDELKEIFDEFDKIFIDIPIGLESENYVRTCDELLRQELGSDYASSVFNPPIRPALHAPTYAEASMQSYSITEKKVSLQAWNITPKIREVDTLLQEDKSLAEKVFESHPELLFKKMNGGETIFQNKKTKKGLRHRLSLITDRHDEAKNMFREIKEEYRRNEVGEADIVDAMVLAWFAAKSANEEIKSIPEEPPTDETGLPMAIHYV